MLRLEVVGRLVQSGQRRLEGTKVEGAARVIDGQGFRANLGACTSQRRLDHWGDSASRPSVGLVGVDAVVNIEGMAGRNKEH